jgi:hypothetical protein
MLRREFVVGIGVISLLEVSGTGTSVIIADQTSAHSSVVQPGLVLPNDVGDDAKKASTKDSKKKSTSESQVCRGIKFLSRARLEYLQSHA